MLIGERLKALRIEKNMSQGDIEKHTGLLRCYISRVENGHTIPAVQTLEKIARALEVPMYQLFFAGKPEVLKLAKSQNDWGSGKDAEEFGQFRRAIRKKKENRTCTYLRSWRRKCPKSQNAPAENRRLSGQG
jgi:transcriptional regulator with XRE-family HTH domain